MLPVVAQAQFTFTTNNGAITITGYTGTNTEVTIPSTTNGFPVTSIGIQAFHGCSSLTGVTIPNSVASIENQAFDDCGSLTNVTIPDSVNSIGVQAFLRCYSLASVTIPNSVTSIGNGAFLSCTSLTSITVDTNNPSYSSVAGVLFNKSQTVIIAYPSVNGSYTVPNSVTNIGFGAFWGCICLTNATIPNGVVSIGVSAFSDCTNLTNVTIGSSVISIGGNAFCRCTSLTSVTIGSSVTNIGSFAFYYCGSLTGVYFRGNSPTRTNDFSVFLAAPNSTVYYLPGAIGWGSTFDGIPVLLWNPQVQTKDGSFGVKANCFGFNVTGTENIPFVVEACTNLGGPWTPLQTLSLTSFGLVRFNDPKWTNYPNRFYRIRSP